MTMFVVMATVDSPMNHPYPPVTDRPQHPRPLVMMMVMGIMLHELHIPRNKLRSPKHPLLRRSKPPLLTRVFLDVPLLDGLHALEIWVALELLHIEQSGHDVLVDVRALIPAAQALVAAFQLVEVLSCYFGRHGVDRLIVVVVALDHETEDLFVDGHRLAVVSCTRVAGGEQVRHVQSFGVQRSPGTAKVVADIFT